MIIADLHSHTSLCKHAEGSPMEYLQAAVRNGLRYYGIADHTPWPSGYDALYRMSPADFPAYLQLLKEVRERGAEQGIEVLSSMEVDWVPGRMDELWNAFDKSQFDYLIGSVHYVGDFAYDDPDLISEWQKPGVPEKVWHGYMKLLRSHVAAGGFEIIAHPDLPKKFGYHPEFSPEFLNAWHEIFTLAAENQMAVELNTNGLVRPAKEIYPSLTILKIAHEHKIPVTFGSDSHKPGDLGHFYAEAVKLAEAAGYHCFNYFRKHVRYELPFS